jgi:hypothetical protein
MPTESFPLPEPVVLLKTISRFQKKTRYVLPRQPELRNNIQIGIGLLEFANGLDFAANVWNEVPVPRFAVGLMAAGGSLTIMICLLAFYDFKLALENVRILRAEQNYLTSLVGTERHRDVQRDLDRRLGVITRELGTEIIDRVFVNIYLSGGGLIVGVGTLLAIGGANRRVFVASNLLSGYIGNSFSAVWGIINVVWSVYIWRRYWRQGQAAKKADTLSVVMRKRLRLRCRRVRWHALTMGITGLVSGAAGLMTATLWWAYFILIPCIFSAGFCNFFLRMKISYHRRTITTSSWLSADPQRLPIDLSTNMDGLHELELRRVPSDTVRVGGTEESVPIVTRFLEEYDLFPRFCEWLLQKDPSLASSIVSDDDVHRIAISPESLMKTASEMGPHFHAYVHDFMRDAGWRYFEYRQRYLLDLLAYDILHYEVHDHV